jgi:hypothetical protein
MALSSTAERSVGRWGSRHWSPAGGLDGTVDHGRKTKAHGTAGTDRRSDPCARRACETLTTRALFRLFLTRALLDPCVVPLSQMHARAGRCMATALCQWEWYSLWSFMPTVVLSIDLLFLALHQNPSFDFFFPSAVSISCFQSWGEEDEQLLAPASVSSSLSSSHCQQSAVGQASSRLFTFTLGLVAKGKADEPLRPARCCCMAPVRVPLRSPQLGSFVRFFFVSAMHPLLRRARPAVRHASFCLLPPAACI